VMETPWSFLPASSCSPRRFSGIAIRCSRGSSSCQACGATTSIRVERGRCVRRLPSEEAWPRPDRDRARHGLPTRGPDSKLAFKSRIAQVRASMHTA
jgi:hypothetical protein